MASCGAQVEALRGPSAIPGGGGARSAGRRRDLSLSGVDEVLKGTIVVNPNGEGRGAACRAIKPKENNETN